MQLTRRTVVGGLALSGCLASSSTPSTLPFRAQFGRNRKSLPSRAALASEPTIAGLARIIVEPGREGVFIFNKSDLSNETRSDPAQGIYVPPASDLTGASGAWVREFTHLTPEMFGAVGDGTTDDFAALKSMVSLVNRLGTAIIVLEGTKTYVNGQYITASNGHFSRELAFENCDGLTIFGNGAKIDVKGNFHRSLNTTYAFNGLYFENCTSVSIFDLEIDGNINEMTRDPAVLEPSSYGIRFGATRNITLNNLHLHHNSGDGLLFRDGGSGLLDEYGKRISCRTVRAKNVRCLYNGRQGMSVTALRTATFDTCKFSWTGRHRGSYAGHSPRAGVDVEPDRDAIHPTAPTDVDTGELTWVNCVFEENAGSQFVCGGARRYDNIHLLGCRLTVGGGSTTGADAAFFGANGRCSMIACKIELSSTEYNHFRLGAGSALSREGDIEIADCSFTGAGSLLQCVSALVGVVRVHHNSYTFTGASSAILGRNLGLLVGNSVTRFRFDHNDTFFPAKMHNGSADAHVVARLDGQDMLVERNTWRTDLPVRGNRHFAIHSQRNSTNVRVVEDEFIGTSRGFADTIRPRRGWSRATGEFDPRHDTRKLYSSSPALTVFRSMRKSPPPSSSSATK